VHVNQFGNSLSQNLRLAAAFFFSLSLSRFPLVFTASDLFKLTLQKETRKKEEEKIKKRMTKRN